MSYKVENLENSMAKITIEVSPEAFEEAMKKSYNKNKNKIALPGFRKGKAPRKLIEKEYGEKCLEVVQKISAVPLPAEAAMYLDAQVGSPCLRILRHYMGIKRNILEISESYHPGDRYALTMNMRANR